MPLTSGRTPLRAVALWAFLLHALAASWIWLQWGSMARGGLLFWMDFPVSLTYAGIAGRGFLVASLIVGGALWAALGAGLSLLVARAVRPQSG